MATKSEFITLYSAYKKHRIMRKDWEGAKTILVVYNQHGDRVNGYYSEGEGCHGLIHRENLSLTKAAAIEKSESIWREQFPPLYEGA